MDWLPIDTAPREEWVDILVWVDTLDIPDDGGDWQIEGGFMVVQWNGEAWIPSLLSNLPEGSVIVPSHWARLEPPANAAIPAPWEKWVPKHDCAA